LRSSSSGRAARFLFPGKQRFDPSAKPFAILRAARLKLANHHRLKEVEAGDLVLDDLGEASGPLPVDLVVNPAFGP
jgi:hypothetical protein